MRRRYCRTNQKNTKGKEVCHNQRRHTVCSSVSYSLGFDTAVGQSDVFDVIAGLTIFLLPLGLIFGLLASGIIFMWAILRGGPSYLVFRKVIITIGGWLLDIVLLGIFPIRTIALLLTFWINNRDANRRIKEATERIDELSKSA